MKFRCRMNNVVAMKDFCNIITTISRIARLCVMRLTKTKMYFIIEVDEKAPSAWVEISQDHFFERYTMAGISDEFDEIFLEFDCTALAKSLFSLKGNATSARIDLTHKQQPCLTVEIELPSLSSQSRQVVHDIPVRVIPRREWTSYQLPAIPDFDLTLNTPDLKVMRSIVERLKNMSCLLIIDADESGHLSVKVRGTWADISTHFKDLQVWDAKQSAVSATVDLKQFLMFFMWESIHPGNVKCNILHQQTVNFYFNIDDYLIIQYFIPSMEE